MEKMDVNYIDPLWHLADVLSLHDAAALVAGYNPHVVQLKRNDASFQQDFPKIHAIETALGNAVEFGYLKAEAHYVTEVGNIYGFSNQINMLKTQVKSENIRLWLASRGIEVGFFFPNTNDTPDFLDPLHKSYAPKLAAAIGAWQAVNAEPKLLAGKTAKQALRKWLRKNADQLSLIKDDGTPNKQGIEEIAKIANWSLKGGPAKTPG